MAQAHIPQPDASGPGEVIYSTDTAPHGPTVSGIGVPGPTPREVSDHTGAFNTIDITVGNQFIPTDTITWSVAQPKGTLLWYCPIHPDRSNVIYEYLSRMYNCWGGGFDFNFKIAGTGFHAGCISICRIPPNRHPTEFTKPSDWGPFEWVSFDPKMLEVAAISVRDQRPINYHYTGRFNEKDPNSFGGYVAMYVLIKLATASTGNNAIGIQVFCKASQDFQFSQLISPYIEKDLPITVPQQFDRIFDFSKTLQSMAAYPRYVSAIRVLPNTTIIVKEGMYNCFSGPDKTLTRIKTFAQDVPKPLPFFVAENVNVAGKVISQLVPSYPVTFDADSKVTLISSGYDKVFVKPPAEVWEFKVFNNFSSYTTTSDLTEHDGDNFLLYSLYNEKIPNVSSWKDDNEISSPLAGESFLVFGDINSTLFSLQTTQMSVAFASGDLSAAIPPHQCLLYQLFDVNENLPIAYCKLYSDGFFTTTGSADITNYVSQNMALRFDSFILRTDPIPNPIVMAQSRLSVRAIHDRKMEGQVMNTVKQPVRLSSSLWQR